jgi:hypothetical protein
MPCRVAILFRYFARRHYVSASNVLMHSHEWPIVAIVGDDGNHFSLRFYLDLVGPIGVGLATTRYWRESIRLHERTEPLHYLWIVVLPLAEIAGVCAKAAKRCCNNCHRGNTSHDGERRYKLQSCWRRRKIDLHLSLIPPQSRALPFQSTQLKNNGQKFPFLSQETDIEKSRPTTEGRSESDFRPGGLRLEGRLPDMSTCDAVLRVCRW